VPEQEFYLLQITTILPAEFGAGAAEVVGTEVLDANCFDDCSTTDQIAQSPSSSPTILPDFESGRSSLPLSTLAAVIQVSMACLCRSAN
jgi:hypothetical protein